MRLAELIRLNCLRLLGGLEHQGREVFEDLEDDAGAVPIHDCLTDQGTQSVDVHEIFRLVRNQTMQS